MIFEVNQITKAETEFRKGEIIKEYPFLENAGHDNFLLLWEYLTCRPEIFYQEKSAKDTLDLLEKVKRDEPNLIKRVFSKTTTDFLSIGFKTLKEINRLDIHDQKLPDNEYERMLWIDKEIHPNYLKLVEPVFASFIQPICDCFRVLNKKVVSESKFDANVQYLRNTSVGFITEPFNKEVRNAIAHGGITYKQWSVVYKDSKNRLEMYNRDIVILFDNMLDICNGLSLAFALFLLKNLEYLETEGVKIPLSLLINETVLTAECPGWEVQGCLESAIIGNRSQLTIFTKDRFYDPLKVHYNAIRTAAVAEKLAPGYNSYFVALSSKRGKRVGIGWVSFEGSKLKKLREEGKDHPEKYSDILDDRGYFIARRFNPPRLLFKISNYATILAQILKVQLKKKRSGPSFISLLPRSIVLGKQGLYSKITGTIVLLSESSTPLETLIRVNIKKIVKGIVVAARKKSGFKNLARYLPAGYIKVSVVVKDFRLRELTEPGLLSEFICVVEFKRIKRIRSKDLLYGIPETIGNTRIVWNKNYSTLNRLDTFSGD